MTFVVALLALFLERVLIEEDDWRRARWFPRYLRRLRSLPYGPRLTRGVLGVVLVLAPPLALVALFQAWLGDSFAGVPDLVFGTAVLLYSFGPGNLEAQVQDFSEALEDDDETRSRQLGRELLGEEPPVRAQPMLEAVVRAIPVQALQRIFSVLFWFVLLGPLGALLYRLASHLRDQARIHGDLEGGFRTAAERLPSILDWLPARITVGSYALAGAFDGAVSAWRDASAEDAAPQELVERAGAAALAAGPEADAGRWLLEQANALVWRAAVIWMAFLGVATLAYWTS